MCGEGTILIVDCPTCDDTGEIVVKFGGTVIQTIACPAECANA
jgi:hypothetical protein